MCGLYQSLSARSLLGVMRSAGVHAGIRNFPGIMGLMLGVYVKGQDGLCG